MQGWNSKVPHCSILKGSNDHSTLEVDYGERREQQSRILCGCDDLHGLLLRVAEDPETPDSVLAQMACDDNEEIRLSVAENPSTPLLIVELLALDESADVRYGIAENPNIPIPILRMLARDENPYVVCRAEHTIENIANQFLRKAG